MQYEIKDDSPENYNADANGISMNLQQTEYAAS